MLLLTATIVALAATAPDAEVEKKLPVVKEINQEAQLIEEQTSEEIALNDLVLDEVEANEEE